MNNFFSSFFSTYNKGLKYDIVIKQFTDCINDLQEQHNALQLLYERSELLSVGKDLVVPLEEKPSKIAFNHVFDIKLESKAYLYDYTGKGRNDIKNYLRVKAYQEPLVKKHTDIIEKDYDLTCPLDIVEAVQKYIIDIRPRYIRDEDLFDKKEFWSWEYLLTNNKGDCDDVAGAMHVLIQSLLTKYNFIDAKKRLLFHINDNYKECHANNIWLADDGYFYTVESTMDLKGTFKRKWLKVPLMYDSFYTKHIAFATEAKSHVGSNIIRKNYLGDNNA